MQNYASYAKLEPQSPTYYNLNDYQWAPSTPYGTPYPSSPYHPQDMPSPGNLNNSDPTTSSNYNSNGMHTNNSEQKFKNFETGKVSKRPYRPPSVDTQKKRRQQANWRERRRMDELNKGFEMLREHLPNPEPGRKHSKQETLQLALEYIDKLGMILKDPRS